MTFAARIQNLIGTYTSTANMDQALDEAVRFVLGELPEDVLLSFSVEETDDGTNGVDVTSKRIVKAHKNGYPATLIDETLRTRLTETAKATPKYYVLGNTAYVLPDGGTVVTVGLSKAISNTDESITGFPTMLTDMVVERAALLLIDQMMVDVRDGFTTTPTLPSPPTVPASPSISYANASASTVNATTIAALPTAPTYTAPSLVAKPTAPTAGALDLTTKVDGVTTLAPPTAPVAPSIASVDAVADSVSGPTIEVLPSPPSYTAPTFGGSLSLPNIPALDLSTEIDDSTTLAVPEPPDEPALSSAGQDSVTVDLTVAGGVEPAYTRITPTAALDFSDWTTHFDLEEESMMAEVVRKASTELQELQTRISDESNEYQKELELYRAQVQKAIQDAQIGAQEAANELRSEDEMALQDYVQGLARYDRQLAEYQAKIGRQVTAWETEYKKAFEPWAKQQSDYLQKLQLDIAAESDAFAGAMQDHMREADRILQQAQISLEAARETARLATDTAQKNEAQTLAAAIQDYTLELQLYTEKTRLYQLEVEAVVQQYTADLDRSIQIYNVETGVDVQRYGAEVTNARAAFEKDLAVYRAALERNNLAAQIAAQEAETNARLATDTAVRNAAETTQAAIASYQSVLQKFQSDLEHYSQQVRAALDEQRVLGDSLANKLRMMNFDRDRQEKRYQQRWSSFVRNYWPRRNLTVQLPTI